MESRGVVDVAAIADLKGVGARRQALRRSPSEALAALARCDLRDGAEIIRRAILQGESNRARSVRPSNRERLASFNTAVVAIGKNDLGSGQARENDGRDGELHFSRFC